MSFDYESPIKAVMGDMQMQYENEILKAVQNVDITVDKAELLKALKYDRAQYEKGYEDGKKGEWISTKNRLPEPFVSVLVYIPGREPYQTVFEGFLKKDGRWYAGKFGRTSDEITHWMEMPEPPKEG